MANTKDMGTNPYPAILVIGDGGTGKTVFAGTFPKPYFFDFDRGMASLRGKDVEFDTFKDAPKDSKAISKANGIYPWGTAWTEFIRQLNVLGEMMDKGLCPHETIVLDSLTTMANIALHWVLKQTNHNGSDPVDPGRWYQQMSALEQVMDQLTSWPIIKVVTAHIQRDTNSITQNVEQLALVTGKLAGKLPIYFDEVYFTKIVGKGREREFVLQTVGDGMVKQAKSRYRVPDSTAANWSSVKPFISA